MDKEEYYMEVARLTSKRSTCISKQVGAVLVDENNRIIMTSFNGVPSGNKHCKDINQNLDREKHHQFNLDNELHDVENAIAYCAKNGIKTKDSILYSTLSPCIFCAKLILVSGIKKVVYDEKYDLDVKGINFLKKNGVKCVQYYKSI